MKTRAMLVAVLVVMFSMLVQAQTGPAAKPGPEHKQLGALLGSWSVDTEMKAGNAYGVPAGKLSYVERYQWMPGEFFLQMNRDGKGPGGEIKHMIILGYDSVAKKHTGTWYELVGGGSAASTITINGNTWLWSGSGHSEGKRFQERCTTVITTASFTDKCETSFDGKTWSPAAETKGTKVNP